MASEKKEKGYWHEFKISINFWAYGKLEDFAKKNDMSIRGAVRFIVNQFFKGKI